jgi:Transglycosylase-like domain
MLARLSARFPVFFRVFLTALSTALLITSTGAFKSAPIAVSASSTSPAAQPSNTILTAAYRSLAGVYDAHEWHLLHLAHLAHLSYLQQLAAQARYAAARPAAHPVTDAVRAPVQEAAAESYSGSGSFQSCVISRESGGNPDAQNPASTASGLYGFLDTTWTAVTGLPGPARDYSVSRQTAAFDKLYAEAGTSPWAPSDGC